jgi:ABC-type amino acid transport system permease subunit
MMVRIKLQQGRPIQRKAGKNRQVASAIGALLIPVALMAYVLGIWRLASDLGMAGEFAITGLFSHWQIWIAVAVALHIGSASLNRYGRGGTLKGPRLLHFRQASGSGENPAMPPKKIRLR